ncbi:hypothetical protein [Nitrosopumilus piranensis]|uniref:Transcriptional regulator n=1 Tax=Nitrosopumilus piranensis TaxID=1582439 RepID=A0A0C5BUN5_9ARCH|nr:hypothetical protein [Nitrosopumilus piranensis]AJM91914.1 hypothetical protein NPIRD3C_0700 [Nitrosopumilus piranensis]
MRKKLRPLLVEKYDISHKVFNELADLESRHILFSIINEPKMIQDISKELNIPLSSTYKKISKLKDCSLVSETHGFSETGHVVTWYQSRITNAKISIANFELNLSFVKNRKVKGDR